MGSGSSSRARSGSSSGSSKGAAVARKSDAADQNGSDEGRRHGPTQAFEQQYRRNAADQRKITLHGVDDAGAAKNRSDAESDQSVDKTVRQAGKNRLEEKIRVHRGNTTIGP